MIMEEVVTARLEKNDVALIDKFVTMGYFTNRSDAIRSLLMKGVDAFITSDLTLELIDKLEDEPILSEDELTKYGSIIFDKPLADLVSEGRER